MADEHRADRQPRQDELVRDEAKPSEPESPTEPTEEAKEEVEDDDRFQATDN